MVECLPSVKEVRGLILSTGKERGGGRRGEETEIIKLGIHSRNLTIEGPSSS